MGPSLIIAVVGGLAALAFVVARGGLDGARYVITVRSDGESGVTIKGSVPGYAHNDVAEFVAGLQMPRGAQIRGVPEGDRVVLRFSSQVPSHLQQRLRNFFYLRR
ncbi:MAG: DUF3634 family protein [Myxococcota bacterium]